MVRIQKLWAREILDSRDRPTIEIQLTSAHAETVASVPSGASVGKHEALELRDEDGRGVSKAIAHINETIATAVVGKSFNQQTLDAYLCELDSTSNKSRLGANAILGVSIAFARAEAREQRIELYAYLGSLDNRNSFSIPQPIFNILNGGKHTVHGIDIQECMLAPINFATTHERIQATTACMLALKELLEKKGYRTNMGDEGGFAPSLTTNDEALGLIVAAQAQAGYTSEQIHISLDIAASSFYTGSTYVLRAGGKEQRVTKEEMLHWYTHITKQYPIFSIEDGFAEDDWNGFVALTKELGDCTIIVGDDLTVTNVKRITKAIHERAANACIIKPNQVGTISEAIDAVQTARKAKWKIFASHRSGETMDTFIADFAVGLACDYLKAGAPTRPERMAKYNRLMEIETKLHIL